VLKWATHCLHLYMLCHTTWLISKMDAIKYNFENPTLSGKLAWWEMLLLEYDIIYVTHKVVKESSLAEYLAQPIKDYQFMQVKFLDEDILALFEEKEGNRSEKAWILLFDGASNVSGHGIGVVRILPKNQYFPRTTRLCFNCTNNVAEY